MKGFELKVVMQRISNAPKNSSPLLVSYKGVKFALGNGV